MKFKDKLLEEKGHKKSFKNLSGFVRNKVEDQIWLKPFVMSKYLSPKNRRESAKIVKYST